jgi:hypothetical protein
VDARALIPAGAAVVFVVFLMWKMWPSVRGPLQRRRSIDPRLPALREKAAVVTGAERARVLCEAGDVALEGARQTAAFGYYLRAARADVAAGAPIRGIARALGRKPRSLERVLWRHLSTLDVRSPAARATLEELVALYQRTRDRNRARSLENLLALVPRPVVAGADERDNEPGARRDAP